jgi:co-chaperonin GroES (HSP10)
MMKPLHGNIIVRRYTKPEQAGAIVLPDAYLGDRTQTLFEVVAAGPCAEQACEYCRAEDPEFTGLLFKLQPDDIVTLRHGWAAVSVEHVIHEDVWVLHARHVMSIIRWREDGAGG